MTNASELPEDKIRRKLLPMPSISPHSVSSNTHSLNLVKEQLQLPIMRIALEMRVPVISANPHIPNHHNLSISMSRNDEEIREAIFYWKIATLRMNLKFESIV